MTAIIGRGRYAREAYPPRPRTGGPQTLGYVAKSADYSVQPSDFTIDCTDNSFTVTLPTAVGNTGRVFVIKNSGNGTAVTVAAQQGQMIDGEPTQILLSKVSITVQSSGSDWIIL